MSDPFVYKARLPIYVYNFWQEELLKLFLLFLLKPILFEIIIEINRMLCYINNLIDIVYVFVCSDIG